MNKVTALKQPPLTDRYQEEERDYLLRVLARICEERLLRGRYDMFHLLTEEAGGCPPGTPTAVVWDELSEMVSHDDWKDPCS